MTVINKLQLNSCLFLVYFQFFQITFDVTHFHLIFLYIQKFRRRLAPVLLQFVAALVLVQPEALVQPFRFEWAPWPLRVAMHFSCAIAFSCYCPF